MSKDPSSEQSLSHNGDDPLRPRAFADFIGQEHIKENLQTMIAAAQLRNQVLGDLLIYGPDGAGKRTLGMLVAGAVDVLPRIVHARSIRNPEDLAAILETIPKASVLIIENINQLSSHQQAMLSGVVEEDTLEADVVSRGRQILPPFTVIGTVDTSDTLPASVSSTLRERFDEIFHLAPYSTEQIQGILFRASRILNTVLDQDGAEAITQITAGNPRDAIRLLKHARDYAQARADGRITPEIVHAALP